MAAPTPVLVFKARAALPARTSGAPQSPARVSGPAEVGPEGLIADGIPAGRRRLVAVGGGRSAGRSLGVTDGTTEVRRAGTAVARLGRVRAISEGTSSVLEPRIPPWADVTVSVYGPGDGHPTLVERERLLGRPAADELSACLSVVAEREGRVVGIALFERADRTVFVRDVACDGKAPEREAVLAVLVHALELASQAGGATRLVFPPGLRLLDRILRRRGYHLVRAECAGCWFERTFP